MATVITFINEKGGIGKTSCCFNIAWEMAKHKKVLMIDMDGQRANLSFFCGIEKDDEMLTMFNVLQNTASIEQAAKQVKEGLHIVPANITVSNINQTAKISRMKKAIEEVKADYDYIFMDVNPSPSWVHVLTLSSSDYIIIPMLPDIASLEANVGIAESVQEVQGTTNPQLKVLGIVFNKYDNRTNLSKQVQKVTESMAAKLDTSIFETRIRNAVALGECVYSHVGITDYDEKSAAANDIMKLTKEIERKI